METVPAWIEAIATVLAFVAASIAAFAAWRTMQHDRERSRREAGAGVSAWWVHSISGTEDAWGVIITNTSSNTRTGVRISTRGNARSASGAIEIGLLPPGLFFVESCNGKSTENRAWHLPRSLVTLQDFEALTRSTKHEVTRIEYDDSASATSWSWTPTSGLTELRQAGHGTIVDEAPR
ncbi:hypothetical protein J2Y69_000411 [Microbacterium resistens]|uniref:Secreted protein n=1 Tax=Microbacterium resistens TaxID=156977 RepID=A0ABU1S898_9MICO|nr:hypothetical protein [Microbacterium resistens]